MAELTSTATFSVGDAATAIVEATLNVLPSLPVESGLGRIVHPTLGAYDYAVKPDEWINIDTDAVIAPVWASTRTLTGAANVLWPGYIKDTVAEEHWKSPGGLSMPITMLRMLMMIWTNPVDPATGYVTWYPNYISPYGYKVIPFNLTVGGQQGITLDDIINYKTAEGDPDGWVTGAVAFQLKLVERL